MPNTILTSPSTVESFPIVGPQLGIWLADQLATENNVFTVAQYVELCGDIDVAALKKAIKLGLSEADTVHSTYENKFNGAIQTIPLLPLLKQPYDAIFVDLSFVDSSMAVTDEDQAISLMHSDIQQAPRASDTEHSYHHKIIKLRSKNGKQRWFWYQRYHHLMLDGFSFTALTQRIAVIYSALVAKRAIGDSPFTAYSQVIAEYVTYDMSNKKEKDKEFW